MSKLKTAQLWQKAAQKTSANKAFTDLSCKKMLKNKSSFSSIALSVVDTKRERDKELKAKISELDDVKGQLQIENEEKKKLRLQVEELSSNQTETNQKLKHFVDTNDKLRIELRRKTDSLDKLEKHVAFCEDRIRNLEIKASEVEKAELTLESTKKLLETSQGDCRSKDSELRRMKIKMDETERDLKAATKRNKDLELTIEDLKKQVRQELMTNESIERGLQSIPMMKSKIGEQKERVDQLEKDLADKNALLKASKQAIREYKDKIREANDKVTETEELRNDLTLSKHEIETLKTLMKGKDTVMIQKLQTLDQAKKLLHSPKSGDKYEDINKLKASIDKLSKVIRSDSSLDYNHSFPSRTQSACYTSTYISNGQYNLSDRKPLELDNRYNCHSRPVTAVVYPCVRPNTVAGTYIKNKKYITTDFDIFSESKTRQSKSTESDSDSPSSELFDSGRRLSDQEILNSLSPKEKDGILVKIISVGDRVKISVPQKQPRYGRKKINPINYSGIVKYRGYLGKPPIDSPLMIGVKLDEPNGDTEGLINGINYMFTPVNQGKFFKIREVTSVFDKNTGSYIATEILTVQYANQQQTDQKQSSSKLSTQ